MLFLLPQKRAEKLQEVAKIELLLNNQPSARRDRLQQSITENNLNAT
jgi:hypothetical protein